MGLETATYVQDLNATNPVGATDLRQQGDDHLRLIKNVLKTTFPNATEAHYAHTYAYDSSAAYTVLATDINKTIYSNASAGPTIFTLPSVAGLSARFRVTIGRVDFGNNTLVVDGNGTNIMYRSKYPIGPGEVYTFVWDVTNGTWMVEKKAEAFPGLPGGRLSLQNSIVSQGDVLAATTIYWGYYKGLSVLHPMAIGSPSNDCHPHIGAISLALDSNAAHTNYHQSGKNFDIFMVWDPAGNTWRIGTGPAWTSDTARGSGAGTTEINLGFGWPYNVNTMNLRYDAGVTLLSCTPGQALYLGTFRASANGQCEDSAAKRFLWNYHNRRPRKLLRQDTTNTWNYSTAAYQQANASAANQVEFVSGSGEDEVIAALTAWAISSTATVRRVFAAIGLDSTTAKAADSVNGAADITSTVGAEITAAYSGFPGLGYHRLTMLEKGNGTDTQTWHGDNGGTDIQTGLVGQCFA